MGADLPGMLALGGHGVYHNRPQSSRLQKGRAMSSNASSGPPDRPGRVPSEDAARFDTIMPPTPPPAPPSDETVIPTGPPSAPRGQGRVPLKPGDRPVQEYE